MTFSALIRSLSALLILLLASKAMGDQYYPVTLEDVAGRQVTLAHAPTRILLQNNNDLVALSVLERENPLKRVVAWQENLRNSDPSLWQLFEERWPESARVPEVEFSSSGSIDIESIIRLHPDLVVARLEAKPAVDRSVLGELLGRLEIPLIYVDNEMDPLRNVPRSMLVLGKALDQETRAEAYVEAYTALLRELRSRSQGLPQRRVFIEARAGQAGGGACCHSQSGGGWAELVEALGATNVAAELLPGSSGDIALETLIRLKPDVFLMTGTQRVRKGISAVPFGYRVDRGRIREHMKHLVERPGFRLTRPEGVECSYGLYHQFYNSIFNVIGMEYAARIIWPQSFADLEPDQRYSDWIARFTDLPKAEFVFEQRYCD